MVNGSGPSSAWRGGSLMNLEHASKTYDLIIAGAGLAGLSLAYALARQSHWRIALIESQPQAAAQTANFDERVLALSAMTVRILKTLDLWHGLDEQGSAIRQIHVSDQGHYGKVRLYAHQQGLDAFGQVMPARVLGEALQQATAALPIDWYRPATIVSTNIHSDQRLVRLDTGETLATKLLVVAEGAGSHTCQLLNVQARKHDYQHVAIIANIRTKK